MQRGHKHVHFPWLGSILAGLLFMCSLGAQALNPQLDISQYAHTAWKVRDDFTKVSILAIAQTPDGYLWLGGGSGLFRFDGTHFERFHAPSGDQLLSTNIYKTFAAPTGGLWIGYALGGFSFVKDGRVTTYGADPAAMACEERRHKRRFRLIHRTGSDE
jgi:ligand-binding sensor domain-containing protein